MVLYKISRTYFTPLARLVFRPIVTGRNNIPLRGRVILASNHLSFVDSIVIMLLAPRQVSFLAKESYFTGTGIKGRMSRAFFTAIDAIPVDRSSHKAAQASLELMLEKLNEEGATGIYPEGTRSRDCRLYKGRTGVAWLANTAGAPVVPVGVAGTQYLQPVGKVIPRLHRITVRFGEPMDFSDLPADMPAAKRRKLMTERIMDAIAELSGQERVDAYNSPPATPTV